MTRPLTQTNDFWRGRKECAASPRIGTRESRKRTGSTRGWQVRVIRRGIRINEFFADAKFGGRAGALSEAMHFRDAIGRELPTDSAERNRPAQNGAQYLGHSRRAPARQASEKRGGTIFEYVVWTRERQPRSPANARRATFTSSQARRGRRPRSCHRAAAALGESRWRRPTKHTGRTKR